MNSEKKNSLIDFDSFDPFAPTAQNVEIHQTDFMKSDGIAFSSDPFVTTFDDDNWQDAMNNISTNKDSHSFGESFGVFDTSENFAKDWDQHNTPRNMTISSEKNIIMNNHDGFNFVNTKQEDKEIYHEEINEVLKFDESTGKSLPSANNENSRPSNSALNDEVHERDFDLREIDRESRILNPGLFTQEKKDSFSQDAAGVDITIKSANAVSKIDNENDEDLSVGCGKDVVNETLVFVGDNEHIAGHDEITTGISEEQSSVDLIKEANSILDRVYKHVSKAGQQNFSGRLATSADPEREEITELKIVPKNLNEQKEICKGQTSDESPKEDSSEHTRQDFRNGRADEIKENNQTSYGNYEPVCRADARFNISTPVVKSNEGVTDFEFTEDVAPTKRGLAGLRRYDQKAEEEFSFEPTSRSEASVSSTSERASSKIFNYGSSLSDKCKQCEKRVYEMEKITVDLIVYHKTCFKCATCARILSPSTYSATDGQIYCKADFLKNFKVKGSYAFTPDSYPSKIEMDSDTRITMDEEEETPVVPMKLMKNLFEKNETKAEDWPTQSKKPHERLDSPDGRTHDLVTSSNVYVIDDELPPPATARNLRAMFETKSDHPGPPRLSNGAVDAASKNKEKKKKAINDAPLAPPSSCGADEEQEENSDVPQAGLTRSLLEKWKDIEGTSQNEERSRSRGDTRGSNAMKRSQSTSRVEISQRLKVVSDGRPKANGNLSKEEGHNNTHGKGLNSSTPASKSFKWQVKEATPLNRPCIVHGDVPRYQAVVGEIINEKTPISEIIRDEDRPRYESRVEAEEDFQPDAVPAKGSYVTEIKGEELPDSAAVKSAMLRFKSMEDPTKEPPIPRKVTPSSSSTVNRLSYHHSPVVSVTHQEDPVAEATSEELPAFGMTRNLMTMFQSK